MMNEIKTIKNDDFPISLVCIRKADGKKEYIHARYAERTMWLLKEHCVENDALVLRAKIGDYVVPVSKKMTVADFFSKLDLYPVPRNVYFSGAFFPKTGKGYVFEYIRPSQQQLPYLTLHGQGLSLCMFSGGLYRISEDGKCAVLCSGDGYSASHVAGEFLPKKVVLSADHKEAFAKAILMKHFYD